MNATALPDKATVSVPIRDRVTKEIKFTAEVECAPNASLCLKLGLAAKWAVENSADLSYADLRSANLRSANLSSANLSSANLRSANLSSADLRSADLRSANLSYADLRSADLSSANLSSADLSYADLRSADLRSADLRSANLSSADLRSANLSSADLRSADLSSASIRDEKVSRIVASVERLTDPYTFIALELVGGGLKVMAGCRWFTIVEFKAHVAAEYANTDKAVETLAILAFIEARAKALGVKA